MRDKEDGSGKGRGLREDNYRVWDGEVEMGVMCQREREREREREKERERERKKIKGERDGRNI